MTNGASRPPATERREPAPLPGERRASWPVSVWRPVHRSEGMLFRRCAWILPAKGQHQGHSRPVETRSCQGQPNRSKWCTWSLNEFKDGPGGYQPRTTTPRCPPIPSPPPRPALHKDLGRDWSGAQSCLELGADPVSYALFLSLHLSPVTRR